MSSFPSLLTARLRLDPVTPDDADDMVAVLGDDRMFEFTGGTPPSIEQLRHRYEQLTSGWSPDGQERWCNWVVRLRQRDVPVGVLQVTVVDDGTRASVAWEVGVTWQGRGIASQGSIAIVDWLIDAGVETIEAYVHPDHDASAGVAANAGLLLTDEVVDGERVWRRSP